MMPASGAPNGGGSNLPTDPDPDVSETHSSVTSSNVTIQEQELGTFYAPLSGRWFHTFLGSPYFLPADDEESTRLKEQHEIFRSLLGENYYLPLTNKLNAEGEHKVLDLGCGPGIWVEEFSERFSSASFIGIDLVPMARQPLERAQFEIYNILDDGIRGHVSDVDAIHARCLSFGYGNFFPLLLQAHRVLSNDGLMFFIEIDWRPEHQRRFPRMYLQATLAFLNQVAECAKLANEGVAWDPTLIPAWLSDAGFGDIQREVRDLPVGRWMATPFMRDLGGLVQTMCIKFAEAMKPALQSMLGADPGLVAQVRGELESAENSGWSIPVVLVTARKAPAAPALV